MPFVTSCFIPRCLDERDLRVSRNTGFTDILRSFRNALWTSLSCRRERLGSILQEGNHFRKLRSHNQSGVRKFGDDFVRDDLSNLAVCQNAIEGALAKFGVIQE